MTVYAQHGYGKSDKIHRGIGSGSLNGVVLSPRDETPANLRDFAFSLRNDFPEAEILFDPQFYATTVIPVRDGHLPDYDYYRSGLARASFISTTNISNYVQAALDYQSQLPLTYLVSPTVLFDDFQDPWSQIALSMAQESLQYHAHLADAPPLLLSLVFSETALRSPTSMAEFLDIVSLLGVTGFYITVRRSTAQYQQQMEPVVLENLLYLTYTLGEINGYEVVMGYTDVIGVLLHAVGARVTSCGWHNSLRQFSLNRFQPSTGGKAPRPRYTSAPLLNSILVIPELDASYRAGFIGDVLTGTSLDARFKTNPSNAPWPADVSSLHHWEALQQLTQYVVAQGSVGARLTAVKRMIGEAKAIYSNLVRRGVVFESASGPSHLDQWLAAIQNFQASVGV